MHLPLLLSALPLVQDTWLSRDLPSACHPTPPSEGAHELLAADHLPFPDRLPGPPAPAAAPVSVTTLHQLVEEALRQEDQRAHLEVTGDLLLLRGDGRAQETVDGVLADLARLDEHLRIDWQVQLSIADQPRRTWTGSSRSGERTSLGARRTVAYIGSQDVNVASDSGVAEPETHHALLGATVHLTCSNLEGGDHLIEGCLDLAELVELVNFDPGTPDLGLLQLPEVASAQVRFAGRNRAEVLLEGLPAPLGGATLVVTTARALEETAPNAWRPFDLAALTRRPPRPLPLEAGGMGVPLGQEPAAVPAPHDAGALASLLGSRGLEASAPLWTGNLLLVQAGSTTVQEASRLLSTLEAHLIEGTLQVSAGPLRATFTAVAGRPARLAVGVERRRATEVGSQLAPSVWMPIVEVERTFDGLVLEGSPGSGRFRATVRQTWGEVLETVPEQDSGLAALQRLERGRRGGAFELSPTAQDLQVLLPEAAGGPSVSARYDEP